MMCVPQLFKVDQFLGTIGGKFRRQPICIPPQIFVVNYFGEVS